MMAFPSHGRQKKQTSPKDIGLLFNASTRLQLSATPRLHSASNTFHVNTAFFSNSSSLLPADNTALAKSHCERMNLPAPYQVSWSEHNPFSVLQVSEHGGQTRTRLTRGQRRSWGWKVDTQLSQSLGKNGLIPLQLGKKGDWVVRTHTAV